MFAFVRTTNNNSEVAILNSMKPHQAMGDSLCYDYLDDTIGVNQLLSMRFLPMARFYEPKYDIMLRAHSTIWRSYQDCQGLAKTHPGTTESAPLSISFLRYRKIAIEKS